MKVSVDVHKAPPDKTLPLTSENLKKFERQFQRSDRFSSRRKVPERTAADGKSAKHSVASAHDNEQLKKIDKQEPAISKARVSDYSRSLYRPARDSIRRNPEGRSQNGSAAIPLSTATKIYYDDTDNRIPYEEPDFVMQSLSRATDEFIKERFQYESSSYSSSAESVVIKPKRVKQTRGSDESVPSSTSASSSDNDLFDDDDYDTSSENATTTITKHMSTTYYTRSNSSVSSLSSIPTNPSPDSSSGTVLTDEKDLETQSIKHTEQKTETPEVEEHKPDISNEIAPPLIDIKQGRPDDHSSLSSDVSISLRNFVSDQFLYTSRKDSVASRSMSMESYITIRNWTRWGTYSRGGYSITDKIIPFNRRNKPRRISNHSSSSSSNVSELESSSTTSDSESTVLGVRSAQSYFSIPEKTPTIKDSSSDDDSGETSDSEESSSDDDSEDDDEGEEENSSGIPSSTNEKPRSFSASLVELRNSKRNSSKIKTTSELKERKTRRRESLNDVEGVDFRYRTKKIPRLRDRPPRPKGGLYKLPALKEYTHSERRRKRKGNKIEEIFPIPTDMEDAKSTFTSSSYTPPLHRRPKLSKIVKAKTSLSISTLSSSASRSSSAASRDSFPGRRRKTVLRPLNINDSGFVTDASPSSCASVRPVDTPFTPVARKISALSLRSILVSDDSGCSSYYRESDSCSCRSASSVGLSSDGESTLIGPSETQALTPPRLSPPPRAKKKPLPPVINARRKSSPYHSSMMPLIIARMKVLRDAIEKTETKQQKKNGEKLGKRKVFRVNHPMPSFTEAYRDVGIDRLIKLAKPKESKSVWATSFWPVRWGDQSMVFPLSKTAVKFNTTPRLSELAVPKKDFRKTDHPETLARDAYQFSCGRSSVILEVSPLAMKGNASDRVVELAKHKTTMKEFEERAQRTNYIFSCGRSSPIWDVSEGAKTAEDRERTMALAAPKKPDSRYLPERPVTWPVSPAARKAAPSPRTEMLARPKTRADRLHREPTWRVSSAALRTSASSRVQELAKPKQTAEGYEPCREIAQPLSRSVLRAGATERIKSLSKPNVRETMDHVQFNPDAFKVSEAALKGRIPDRIAELAQPLNRH